MFLELNGETGEVIERELTDDETAEVLAVQKHYEDQLAAQQATEKARASALAKLKKLGLTDKEIAAL
jgi:hypothetical protein